MSKSKPAARTPAKVTAKTAGQPARPPNRVSSDPAVNDAADHADKNVRGAEAAAIAGAEQGTDPANAVADVDTSAIQPPHPHTPPAVPGNTLAEAQAGDRVRQAEAKKALTGTDAQERVPSRAAEMAAAKKLPRARPAQPAEGEDAPPRELGQLLRVRATRMGFIDNVRRREGDVFDVHEAEFTDKWMEPVEGDAPLRITSGKEELQRKHDEILAGKFAGRGAAQQGSADPLGVDAGPSRPSRG